MDATGDPAGSPAEPTAAEPPAPPVALALIGLQHTRTDGTVVVRGLDLEVRRGEVHCLLEAPGRAQASGGSTVLRLVNRLVEPTGGRVLLDGVDVSGGDPVLLRRRLGYVVRSGGLLPHRTVADNLATVPRLLGWKRARVRSRVDELLDLLGLEPGPYRRRFPARLSAEERVLVSVARALAGEPAVLLADEPFADLDAPAAARARSRFTHLRTALAATVLFATHDVGEALDLGDRIAVLSGPAPLGQPVTLDQPVTLEQDGDPATLLGEPATEVVADLMGADRGLRRLRLTPLHAIGLSRPPTVRAGDRPTFASARLASVGAPWGVVVEPSGTASGWVTVDDLRSGMAAETVAPLARPLPGTAALDEVVLDVLARALLVPEGWLAVLDGREYVGVFDRAGLPDSRTPVGGA